MLDLRNIDCMKLMAEFPDKYFDLAIVDPPYGLDDWNERGSNKKLYNKKHMNLKQIQNFEKKAPQQEYFDELFRVSKHQIIWGGNHFLDYLGKTKQMIVWDKKIRGMHFNDCEIAWASGIKEACRIFSQSANDINRIHPTQKPVKLYNWLLKNYADKGQKILDTHLGSGSIAVACHYAEIDLIGSEIDKEYFDKMMKRVMYETAQQTLQF
jgi:site-specific DNA-methyltransferase (adenine-specific)